MRREKGRDREGSGAQTKRRNGEEVKWEGSEHTFRPTWVWNVVGPSPSWLNVAIIYYLDYHLLDFK